MLGYFWMAFFKDQFKANFYKNAFSNEAGKIYRTSHILNKSSQLTAPDLTVQSIECILHIITATRNSNYGVNARFVNSLLYLFIVSSKIFDRPTISSFIYSFNHSFVQFTSSRLNQFVYLSIHSFNENALSTSSLFILCWVQR